MTSDKSLLPITILGGKYKTALQAATYREKIATIVKLLLEKGADPNIQGERIF
jgi:hypothetical protein